MAFRNFSIGPAKGLRHAEYTGLPNLVVIAGPNRAGKSTLLHQLHVYRSSQAEPGTRVIYSGPHRPWRKTTLSGAAMYSLPYSYTQLSEMDTFPGFQQYVPPNMQVLQYLAGQARQPDTSDESFGFVKYAMAKMGFRRQNVITQAYDDNQGMVPYDAVPELYQPFREITRFLLPHLRFERIDLSNEQDIRVLFRRIDGDKQDLIDIDDLSSGEKAVVSLFLPFLESRIDVLLSGEESSSRPALTTALLDEPDLHLHPTLQVSLIEYLREMADRDEAQFIITTHSPTILDALSDDELFLVAPVASVADGNQFLQVTASEERLEAIRQLTGSTHSVTRGRPIVFIEGVRPAAKGISDQRIVESLLPEAASWVLVPTGGRAEAVRSTSRLREVASDSLPGIPVFCLVDADQATADNPDYAISWSVAMIENLLLDPVAIWKLLFPHRDRVPLTSAANVESELRDIARTLREDEIRLRVSSSIKPIRIPIEPTDPGAVEAALCEARRQANEQIGNVGGAEQISAVVRKAQETVDCILNEGRELEAFRGKTILKKFYDRYGNQAGFSYPNFVYGLAEKVKEEPRLRQLVDVPVRRIQRYIPPTLGSLLELACSKLTEGTPDWHTAREALSGIRAARSAWEDGEADEIDRSALRGMLVQTARALRQHEAHVLNNALLEDTVQVGLG